ncbi:unnamed protein product [Lepeophtheirus salmonis]|uniref:(salmon louse) hypothetical protein n=1 Tax=Lepeophtheirus salmonis TaxID=72036 RepID=A0A7R8CZJ4_LEPSM|nr:unnamed protein product [Lepeophtheirus salmonis]CAF2935067.1 unnamed protein product [Lepeophtheirus salmonis]
MVNYCSVPGCKGVGGSRYPKEPTLQVKWRVAINRINLKPHNLWASSLHSILYHEHLRKEDYDLPGRNMTEIPADKVFNDRRIASKLVHVQRVIGYWKVYRNPR